MECVEAKAFKTSLWGPEMIVKSSSTNQQQHQKQVGFQEDEEVFMTSSWGSSNNTNGGITINGDETFVNEFLDFSNEETQTGVIVKDEEEYETEKKNNNTEIRTDFSPEKKNDFASVFASELSVPTDDLADLEWLSNFVEDSFSEEFSQTQYNDGNPTVLAEPKTGNQDKTEPEVIKTESIETVPQPPPTAAASTVAGKARSKRSRTGGRIWSLGYSSPTETSSSSSPTEQEARVIRTQCSHCGVQKTPQWRTGPLGAKTLCNACGVRYKSGRLLPEYRPASSPTFSRDVHSNSHRKVLEMRKKKEVVGPPEPGFTPAVHSF